jgi:hypothetical protein
MEWDYKEGRIIVDLRDPIVLPLEKTTITAYPAQYRIDGRTHPFTVYTGGDEGWTTVMVCAEDMAKMLAPA